MTASLRDQFPTLMKDAMKAGDKGRLATLRLIQSALKDRDIEARTSGITIGDAEIVAMLQKMVKQRQESLSIYEKAGREDLAATERGEIAVISEFLPQAMGEDDVRAAIRAAIAESGATEPKDMGKVIGVLKAKHAGRMDFGKVSPIVKEMLAAG